jgi:hypothetical protein
MALIRIRAGSVEMLAELNDSETAKAILKALPLRATARTWGDEVYFDAGVSLPEEAPAATVPPGTVAYWPPGKALCLFFGQTPASPVNVVGGLKGNPRDFAAVRPGDSVSVATADEG